MFQFQVLPVRGYPPPMVWSHHGRQGPHTVLCWQQLHEQTVFYNPVCRTLHSTGGEGKMMMMCVCVCVLILPVCFTRPHGMFLVLYGVTNHIAGAPPLTERNWYIYMHLIALQMHLLKRCRSYGKHRKATGLCFRGVHRLGAAAATCTQVAGGGGMPYRFFPALRETK